MDGERYAPALRGGGCDSAVNYIQRVLSILFAQAKIISSKNEVLQMVDIENNRWVTPDNVFASRVMLPDLNNVFEPKGFFRAANIIYYLYIKNISDKILND